MLDIFLNAVLPIFAVVLVGYAGTRAGLFDVAHAAAINRFVFYAALPVLLFRLIGTSPLEEFEWLMIAAYMSAEIALYAFGYLVVRHFLKRPASESLLLGMTAAFPNHVYFVLPIATALFGDQAAVPIVALITVDAVLLFGGTILILEAARDEARGASALKVAGMMIRNPQILALGSGLAFNLAGFQIAGGFQLFANFLGASAAPCSLFALGVILSVQNSKAGLKLSAFLSFLKLCVMPGLAWVVLFVPWSFDHDWTTQTMMIAAGPTGAMPFVLALQYRLPTDVIARVILITTAGSLASVTLMAQL